MSATLGGAILLALTVALLPGAEARPLAAPVGTPVAGNYQQFLPRLTTATPTIQFADKPTDIDKKIVDSVIQELGSRTMVTPRWWRQGDGPPNIVIRYIDWSIMRNSPEVLGGICTELMPSSGRCLSTGMWLHRSRPEARNDRRSVVLQGLGLSLGVGNSRDPDSAMSLRSRVPRYSDADVAEIDRRYTEAVPQPTPSR